MEKQLYVITAPKTANLKKEEIEKDFKDRGADVIFIEYFSQSPIPPTIQAFKREE